MSTYIQPNNIKIHAERRNRSASPVLPRQHFDDVNNNADNYERVRQQRLHARARNARPPYAVHEHMWYRQQVQQEALRRTMTPLNLSTTSTGPSDLCSCEIRHPARRIRPPRTYSIRLNHATPVAYTPGTRSQVHHHVFYRPTFIPDPQVHLSIGVSYLSFF